MLEASESEPGHEKQAPVKSLKEVRRELHEEQSKTAATKKERNRRKMLAESLMRIFAGRDECFNLTLRELDIHKTWGSDSGLTEYRQFYMDSLNSFGTMLAEDIDNEQVLSEVGLDSASVARILDDFEGGRTDNDAKAAMYTKRYLKMSRMKRAEEEFHTTLGRLRKKHDRCLQQVETEVARLEAMELEQSKEREAHLESLGENVMSVKELLPSLTGTGGGNYAVELEKLESELSKALSQVSELSASKTEEDLTRQRSKVDNVQAAAAKLAEKIANLEKQTSEQNWPMAEEEYQTTNKTILGIASSVVPALAKFITNRHDDFNRYRQLEMHTDLTRPHEWYPRARLKKRKIIFHGGPTNSGKTYTALQRLKKAKRGMYLAPLRLLAWETYESLTAERVYCSLLTGQEKRDVPFSTHRASTVELADIDNDYDVVVLDEIQMLSDEFRGSAWTRALLGVRCKEIHVCGGAEAIDLVQKICQMSGDDFEVQRYKRFSDLTVLPESVAKTPSTKGSYKNFVQPGDCIVAFSRNDIFAIQREIERTTDFKCCVVYGSLPPDVRAQQARRFNDPTSGYDILVASDAIGMGLNLSIKRIIFNSMYKSNGERTVQLDHSAVKQIAGRAGRRNSPYPNGEVTCRDPNDMAHLRECMRTEIKPLKAAGLVPTPAHIALFNRHLEEYGSSGKKLELHQVLRKFQEMATLKSMYFLCRKNQLDIVSGWLKDIPMDPAEKYTLCMSPVNDSCPKSKKTLMRYVESYTSGKVPGIPYGMRPRPVKTIEHFADLCGVHQQLELFIWLNNKLPSNAVEAVRATALKERTTDMINKSLLNAEKLSLKHDYISKDMRVKKMFAEENEESD